MSDDVKTVVLDSFPNTFIAEVLVGFLKDEGIAAFVSGENLQDHAAAMDRVLGKMGVSVFVEEGCLEEAQKVLAAARAAGHLTDDIPDAGEDDAEDECE